MAMPGALGMGLPPRALTTRHNMAGVKSNVGGVIM
jgi:hypothetical protein